MNASPLFFRYPALRTSRLCLTALAALMLSACAVPHPPSDVSDRATLTPITPSALDLRQLPAPRHKIVAAVYGFRDETGQYKPSPDSAFSTAVTQGAASMLMEALKESGWYVPVEREGLQSLLTERRVLRAVDESEAKAGEQVQPVPNLMPASVILDGGIVAYDSNVRTGGVGAKFLGIGLSTKYSVDQVTVILRAIDVNTGRVLNSVSTSKTVYSYEVHPSYFRFVNFYDLLEAEAGYTHNEPAQLCVKEAIDAAVAHLTVEGIKDGVWPLRNPADMGSPMIKHYLETQNDYTRTTPVKLSNAAPSPAADSGPNWKVASNER
ncbi:CsgG/HfaB family protein [Castellaniella sp. UC4442_H9]|jgi:curli production assembly/transport component CsgG